jgi:tetratricopeptide (TPR) repeat protein
MPTGSKARFCAGHAGAALAAALGLVASVRSGFAEPPPRPAGSVAASTPTSTSVAVTASASPSAVPEVKPAPVDEAKEKRDRQARAVEFHNEAKVLYERGLYRRAIAKLEAATALDPEGKELVYNLALIHEKLAEADVAEAYYRRYLDMETEPKARERTLTVLKRLEGAKKNLKADIQERAVPTATSSSSPSSPSATPVPSSPVPVAPARTPSPMVFVIGGVAIGAVGVGIGFGVSAWTAYPGRATTGPKTTWSDLESRARAAHTQAIVADLAFATSFIVGAAATVLYLLESRPPHSAPRPAPASAFRARPEVAF